MEQHRIQICRCDADRLSDLQKIGKTTFLQAFEKHNQPENIYRYVRHAFSPEQLQAEFANENSRFFLAEVNGEIAGYLKVNFGPAQTDVRDDNALEIERIYVLEKFHGSGVGQKLFEQAVKIAREHHLSYLWLGVWEKNIRAIRFYEKNGFEKFGTHIFQVGDDAQTDILMRCWLQKPPASE